MSTDTFRLKDIAAGFVMDIGIQFETKIYASIFTEVRDARYRLEIMMPVELEKELDRFLIEKYELTSTLRIHWNAFWVKKEYRIKKDMLDNIKVLIRLLGYM
jgi:hypothetical protein